MCIHRHLLATCTATFPGRSQPQYFDCFQSAITRSSLIFACCKQFKLVSGTRLFWTVCVVSFLGRLGMRLPSTASGLIYCLSTFSAGYTYLTSTTAMSLAVQEQLSYCKPAMFPGSSPERQGGAWEQGYCRQHEL